MPTETTDQTTEPVIGLIMGSSSDWKTMCHTAHILADLGVRCERQVVSAHRTPDDMFRYAEEAGQREFALIIAAAGGAAHLPGMTASKTIVPVIGVPVEATPLHGIDALLSIMQMPAGIGVATVSVGEKGAVHAALFAASIVIRPEDSPRFKRLCDKRTELDGLVYTPTEEVADSRITIIIEQERDREIIQHAEAKLTDLKQSFHTEIINRETSDNDMAAKLQALEESGTSTYIVGSTCELANRVGRFTARPVLGVPIVSGPVGRIDDFIQPLMKMPSGVATFAVGRAGAINAALFAATILSAPQSDTRQALQQMREDQVKLVRAMTIES